MEQVQLQLSPALLRSPSLRRGLSSRQHTGKYCFSGESPAQSVVVWGSSGLHGTA